MDYPGKPAILESKDHDTLENTKIIRLSNNIRIDMQIKDLHIANTLIDLSPSSLMNDKVFANDEWSLKDQRLCIANNMAFLHFYFEIKTFRINITDKAFERPYDAMGPRMSDEYNIELMYKSFTLPKGGNFKTVYKVKANRDVSPLNPIIITPFKGDKFRTFKGNEALIIGVAYAIIYIRWDSTAWSITHSTERYDLPL